MFDLNSGTPNLIYIKFLLKWKIIFRAHLSSKLVLDNFTSFETQFCLEILNKFSNQAENNGLFT